MRTPTGVFVLMISPIRKKCTKCHEVKAIEEFYLTNSGEKYIRRGSCKNCFNTLKHQAARDKKYKALIAGGEDVIKKRKEYYQKNKQRILENQKKYRNKNKQKSFSNKVNSALTEGDIFED